MSRPLTSASVVLIVALAAFAGIALSDDEREGRARPSPEPAVQTPEPEASRPERELVLVRRRDGLPAPWIRRLRRHDAVEALAPVSRTQWLLRRSVTAAGAVADAPPPGYAIPLDVHVVDPRAYARVTGEAAFRRVRAGRALLSAKSARLRRLGRGARMTLDGGRTVRVAGIVPDRLARDAEVVAAKADVARAERRQTAVVVATRDPAAIARAVPDDRLTRVATLNAQPAGRRGIIRPAAVKQRFGEFAVRLPYGGDWIGIDPRWLRRNIVTRRVPILGAVTCNRALIAPLRRALGRLQRRGLARLVDPGDFAGCYAPRRIPASGSLSLHAWGLAIDLNASENPQGSRPRQDRRLVRAFEREGFTWGGRWPTAPDGMHFELHGDPPPAASRGASVFGERRVAPRVLDVNVRSPALDTTAMVRLMTPEGWSRDSARRWPVLYLLHGCCDSYESWVRSTDIEGMRALRDVLVVMPEGGPVGFYSNWVSGPAWETFHLDELPAILERDYGAGGSRSIAGLSMGGLGAIGYAARRRGFFRAAASFSGLLNPLRDRSLLLGLFSAFTPDALAIWGDPERDRARWARHDPTELAPRLRGTGLFVSSGDGRPGPYDEPGAGRDRIEVAVHGESRAFVRRARRLGLPVRTSFYGAGRHAWPYWERELRRALPLLLGAKRVRG